MASVIEPTREPLLRLGFGPRLIGWRGFFSVLPWVYRGFRSRDTDLADDPPVGAPNVG